MVDGSTCSRVWERRTTCWVTMRVPDPNILVVRRLLPVHVGRDLDPHVTACSECEGARACGGGGGCAGPAFGPAPFLLGGVGAAKGLLPCFLVPKGNQPTACTLALWWLKFGPTEGGGWGGGGGSNLIHAKLGVAIFGAQKSWHQFLETTGGAGSEADEPTGTMEKAMDRHLEGVAGGRGSTGRGPKGRGKHRCKK